MSQRVEARLAYSPSRRGLPLEPGIGSHELADIDVACPHGSSDPRHRLCSPIGKNSGDAVGEAHSAALSVAFVRATFQPVTFETLSELDALAEQAAALIGRPGDVLFHYTSLDTAVRHIFPTGQLRMSPFSTMRDPREYQRRRPAAAGFLPPDQDMREWDRHAWELEDRLNELKDRFKLLALTMDDPDDLTVYGRGFARSRLWEAYGDQGKGVCLVFDKAELVSSLMSQLNAAGTHAESRAVSYENRRLVRELFVDIGNVLSQGLEAVVEEIATQHLHALFFTKLTDWASEHEYRFVVATDSAEPLHVEAQDALKAVIMGYECAPHFFPALAELCREPGIKVRQLKWFNVEPLLHGIALN